MSAPTCFTFSDKRLFVCFHPSTRTTCLPEGSHGEICSRSLCSPSSRETTICQVSRQIKTHEYLVVDFEVHTILSRESVVISLTPSLPDWHISSNAILCFCCGLRAFKGLAYEYRRNIPSPELPGQTDQNHF